MEVITQKKRERVSKACVFCRKKKIKCDGQPTCSHCQHGGKECIYPEDNPTRRQRKPRVNKKLTKSDSIKSLDSRLAKLEGLILNLATRIDPNSERAVGSDAVENESNDNDLDDFEDLDESEKDYGEDNKLKNEVPSRNEDQSKKDALPSKESSVTARENPFDDTSRVASLETYFGSHCTFHIFSDKSIKYIKGKLRPRDMSLVVPLENIPVVFAACKETYNSLWTEPYFSLEKERLLLHEGILPHNIQLTFELLEFFDEIYIACYLCDVNEIKELIKTYYSNKENKANAKTQKLKASEHLIVNISLALCISVYINKKLHRETSDQATSLNSQIACTENSSTPVDPKTSLPVLNSLKLEELLELQDQLFLQSIYYYGKVSVISEGIVTVQGILLLIIYLETTLVTSHMNWILVSVAVRFAQILGLHRFESFQNFPEKDRAFRRRIWWFCQYFDMEICYRNGSTPMVDECDVSTLTSRDREYSEANEGCKDEDCSMIVPPEVIKDITQNKQIHNFVGYFLMKLTRIRARSYKGLFSASVKTTFKSISSTLNSLNTEMNELRNSMDKRIRPRLYTDSDFQEYLKFPVLMNGLNIDCAKENVIATQLTYFSHLMTINRLPFQIVTPDHDESCEESLIYRALYLDSARTILHIVLALDLRTIPLSFINWIIFFPFSAFLNLLGNCINKAGESDSMKDLGLLIDVAVKFFGYNNRYAEQSDNPSAKVYQQRGSVIDMVVKTMLRILIKILEGKLEVDILKGNDFLTQYLESCEKNFPYIFTPVDRKDKQFNANDHINKICSKLFDQSLGGVPRWQYSASGFVTINSENQEQQEQNQQQNPIQSHLSRVLLLLLPGSYQNQANGGAPINTFSPQFNYYSNTSNTSSNSNGSHSGAPSCNDSSGYTPTSLSNHSLAHILQQPESVDTLKPGYPNYYVEDQFFKLGDGLDDDSVNNVLFSSLYELPNFFFDNGL